METVQPASKSQARRRAKRHTDIYTMAAMLVVAGGLAWWGWVKTHAAPSLASQLITASVTRGNLVESVSATGSVSAQTGAEVKIGSQITGQIKRLFADVGTHVQAGQLIAELNLPDVKDQLDEAVANLAAAKTKLIQDQTGVAQERAQTADAVLQAQEQLSSARAKLASAQAAASQQTAQTPTDVQRAKTALAAAQAALTTAKASLAQVQASANLQIATAQEDLRQAQASARDSTLDFQRQQQLATKGFVATTTVDAAQAQATVDQSKVAAAQQNVQLVKASVAASLQSAQDQAVQAQQNVVSAQAALAAAQAETYTNAAKLADVNDARAQVQQAETNLQTAQANVVNNVLKQQDIEQAREAVQQAQAQVDYNRAQVNKTYIRSPISGTVLQLAAQQGETLAAGLSAPTLIIVADLDRLQVDAFVDENDIGKVKLGQSADVTVDAFPKHVFKGKVQKIAAGSTIQEGIVTYDVTVAIRDPRHRLRPDMTANVTIQTGTRSNVLLVPSEAIKIGVRGSTVSVLTTQNGKAVVKTQRVKTGSTDGVNTEIQSGLQEGDTVVLAGLNQGQGQQGQRGGGSPFGPGGGGGGRRGL
jgi:RND family efflux transporter MFP subunit